MSKNTIYAVATFTAGLATSYFLTHQEPKPLYAMSAHGTEKKSLITVPLDAGMEAVVALDHVTGDLTGYALDRFSGQFFMQFRRNVAGDFPIRQGKIPGFIMVPGEADFRQFSSNERIADGVIYVAEEDSGQVVAYGIPWNTQFRVNTAGPQQRQFIPLDFAKTRFIDSSAIE